MARPFISALIDTYNHECFIERAITRVLELDVAEAEREILVVDDGSTDRAPEIVSKVRAAGALASQGEWRASVGVPCESPGGRGRNCRVSGWRMMGGRLENSGGLPMSSLPTPRLAWWSTGLRGCTPMGGNGGFPWETVRTELRSYRINHDHGAAAHWILKCLSLLPACFLPSRSYDALRQQYAMNRVYRKASEKWLPVLGPPHVDRCRTTRP
jgi:glycosyltransferase involved in cell wall biosynthesis